MEREREREEREKQGEKQQTIATEKRETGSADTGRRS